MSTLPQRKVFSLDPATAAPATVEEIWQDESGPNGTPCGVFLRANDWDTVCVHRDLVQRVSEFFLKAAKAIVR